MTSVPMFVALMFFFDATPVRFEPRAKLLRDEPFATEQACREWLRWSLIPYAAVAGQCVQITGAVQ